MNILLKKLITSKRVQDTAGVIRGTYRILNVYQSNRSSSLIDLENSQTSQTDETYKHSQDINKKENFPIDEENKIKRQSTDDNSENISSGKEEIILKSNSFNMQEKKMKGSSFSNEEKSI